jgi:hypothetical protein
MYRKILKKQRELRSTFSFCSVLIITPGCVGGRLFPAAPRYPLPQCQSADGSRGAEADLLVPWPPDSTHEGSVADPDPHVFGPPGSGSTSQRYGSGSGSRSFYHHAKIVRKTLIPTIL